MENTPPLIILILIAQTLLILVGSYRLGVAVRRIRIQRKQLDEYRVTIMGLRVLLDEDKIIDTMRGHFQM